MNKILAKIIKFFKNYGTRSFIEWGKKGIVILCSVLLLVFCATLYFRNRVRPDNPRILAERSSLLFGRLPDLDKSDFKIENNIGQGCSITPFNLSISAGKTAEASISLTGFDLSRSYRVVLGDLPKGVKATAVESDKKNKINVKLELLHDEAQQQGSFNLSVFIQSLDKRFFFRANEIKTIACRYSLNVNSGQQLNRAPETIPAGPMDRRSRREELRERMRERRERMRPPIKGDDL